MHPNISLMDQRYGRIFLIIRIIPDIETIRATTPNRHRHLENLIGIIDCSEIFIETPKYLELQSAIWSEYNHQNTLKFLVCIAPNSAITFVSYPRRIKDEEITLKSVFLDMLSRYSNIMAEKGFNLISQYPLAGEVHHR